MKARIVTRQGIQVHQVAWGYLLHKHDHRENWTSFLWGRAVIDFNFKT